MSRAALGTGFLRGRQQCGLPSIGAICEAFRHVDALDVSTIHV